MSSLTSFEENHGAVLVTITRNTDTTNALTVNLSNDQPGRMTVPASVTIAAGASSATFEVTPVNNAVAEGNRTVRISAAANSHSGASLQYLILDDDVPDITLSLATQIISEGDGSTATWGTVTRSDVTESAVIIALHGDPARARVPTYVTIGAGEASVSFAIAAVDNALADGDHTVNILAEVADMFTFLSLPDTRVSRSLLITDNDGQTLSLSVTNSILQEVGGSATATLTRNTAPDGDLVVTLTSSDSTEATVPLTVTIPDGQSSVTFAISAVGDGVQDGTQNVTVVAAATDFNNGSTTVQVTDRELPNLVVSAIDLPESAWTQSRINIDWSVTNSGLGLASGTWTDTVFISVDNMLSADDTQIGVFGNVSELDVGESYSNSVSVQLGNRGRSAVRLRRHGWRRRSHGTGGRRQFPGQQCAHSRRRVLHRHRKYRFRHGAEPGQHPDAWLCPGPDRQYLHRQGLRSGHDPGDHRQHHAHDHHDFQQHGELHGQFRAPPRRSRSLCDQLGASERVHRRRPCRRRQLRHSRHVGHGQHCRQPDTRGQCQRHDHAEQSQSG
jgi:hypothetical protein